LEEIVARDFTVRMGLYNNVPDNSFIRGTGKMFESASAMSVRMRIEL
jgi:hypothetical protein